MHIIVSSIRLVCVFIVTILIPYIHFMIQTKLFFNAEIHSNDFPIKMGHGGTLDKSATGVLGMSIHLWSFVYLLHISKGK